MGSLGRGQGLELAADMISTCAGTLGTLNAREALFPPQLPVIAVSERLRGRMGLEAYCLLHWVLRFCLLPHQTSPSQTNR